LKSGACFMYQVTFWCSKQVLTGYAESFSLMNDGLSDWQAALTELSDAIR